MTTPSRAFSRALTLPAIPLLASAALAQFNNQWVEYSEDNSRINAPNSLVRFDTEEKDYAHGDLDQDGWIDLVIVRKQPFTSSGREPNVLLMNENGTLVNRTSEYASSSDVGSDNGFLTATNDRDVVIVDVDNDGWLDVVTATTLSVGLPHHIAYPRVYMNQGESGGQWQGLHFEDGRMGNLPVTPGFCSVAAGDVTGDGYADLYFSDYSGNYSQDLDDRLFVNDGNGFFTDETSARLSSSMVTSNFGASADIVDLNMDGVLDVLATSGLAGDTRANYNNPNNEGFFNLTHLAYSGAAYFAGVGDLNNDGRPDIVIADDGSDRYRYNLSTNALGLVNWGPSKTFQFLTGSDDGFGSNSYIIDFDNDGWNDIAIADVDVDIPGCSGRTHIYHNPGGAVGSEITLREEAQSSSGGWRGVVGMTAGDLQGTHDLAIFDLDNDGDKDIVIGRCSSTEVWMNQLDPSQDVGSSYCSTTANSVGFGAITAAVGSPSVGTNNLTLNVFGAVPGQFGIFYYGPNQISLPFGDGLRCVGGSTTRLNPVSQASAAGENSRVVDTASEGFSGGQTVNFQYWYRDPAGAGGNGFNLSNGLEINFTP